MLQMLLAGFVVKESGPDNCTVRLETNCCVQLTPPAGMLLGLAFTRLTAGRAAAAWLLFALLTILHVW
jgi:hypothetical protein